MGEMIRVRQEHGGSALLAVDVEPSQVSNYSVFDVEATDVIALLISEGHPGHVVVHDGIRHDLGNPPRLHSRQRRIRSPSPEVRTGIVP